MTKRERTTGETLRDRREELKLTVEQVGGILKVKAEDIRSLEQDSLHLISEHLYLIGFVKSYCRLLKLKDELIEEYLKNITKSCNTKNQKHQLINLDLEADKNPNKDQLINALIIFVMIYLLLIAFSQFKSQNLAITDLIINRLNNSQ